MPASCKDASGKVLRAALIVFVLLTCIRVWVGPIDVVPTAKAQIPDAAAQRIEMSRQQQRTNELLEQILDTLRNSTLKVQMEGTDKTKAPAVRVRRSTED